MTEPNAVNRRHGDSAEEVLRHRVAVSLYLPLASAVLYVLAFPNFNVSSLAWVALVPLTVGALGARPARAFWMGWLGGTLAYGGILYWLVVTFQAAQLSLDLAALCLCLLSAYLGLYWGVWAWYLAETSGRRLEGTVTFTLSAAAAWVALEYLRTYLFSGFPWALLGDSQWRHLALIQISSITGVYGVSFLVVMVNATLALWLSFPRRRESRTVSQTSLDPRLRHAGMTGLLIFGCYAFGLYRLHFNQSEPPPAPTMRVALLQGSIDQYKKWDKAYVDDIEHTYERLNDQAAAHQPDLIVWPETSVPGYLLQEPPLRTWLEGVVRRSRTSHLVGAPSLDTEHNAYNSAYLLDPEGNVVGKYDKQHLVPFGEIVPWAAVLGRWIHVLNELGGFTAGRNSPVLSMGQAGIGVNICYEAIFPDLVRRAVRQGASLIANLTNDGWYMKTAAPYQHFIPNVFRAVENDRWVVRADNTGITAIVNPIGQVQAASPIFEPCVIEGTVSPRRTLTFYARVGDVFAWICCLFCFTLSLRAILRRNVVTR